MTRREGVRMTRRISIGLVAAVGLCVAVSAAIAQSTTITEDMKAAVTAYADEQTKEHIKQTSKAAITALYKKLYGSGANKTLVRTLGTVALSAEEINTLAENAANAIVRGDPESVKAASAQVAVALGQTLTKGLKDPQLRTQMAGLLGNVDKVNRVADVLGQAAGGDSTAAYELAGRTLISMTPAAAVFTAAEATTGAMKYLQGKFVDGNIEELYRRYAAGDAETRAAIRTDLEVSSAYSYIVRDRRMDLEKEKIDSISRATAEPGDKLRERLTAASEREVIDDILDTFAMRSAKERQQAATAAAQKQAQAEATAMFEALNSVARNGLGKDWANQRPYDLKRFMGIVRDRLARDGVLDPHDLRHVSSMAQLLSTRLVYGPNSDEYREKLRDFEQFRRLLQGDPSDPSAKAAATAPVAAVGANACAPGSRNRAESDRIWAEALKATKGNDGQRTLGLMAQSTALCPDTDRLKQRRTWTYVITAADQMSRALPKVAPLK